MEGTFALFLVGALVANIGLSYWQSRAYTADINDLIRAHSGSALRLVSGRGKGWTRGAVVVLVVDPTTREVVQAKAMVGTTVFSRLHPAPSLCGPLAGLSERVEGKRMRQAVAAAVAMLDDIERRHESNPPTKSRIKVRVGSSNPN